MGNSIIMNVRPIALAALAAAMFVAAAQSALAFQLGVAPMRYEIELGPRPETRALKIINQGATDMDVGLRVANFALDENNQLEEIASTPQSLDQWIIIRPLKFTLKAGETRTVRFAVRPLTRPRPGEYRAVIFLERTDARGQQEGRLNVGFRFGVVVYAHAGERVRKARLHGVDFRGHGLTLDVESTGNAHARVIGSFGIWPEAVFPGRTVAAASIARSEFLKAKNHMPQGAVAANLLPDTPVLPGTRRTVNVPVKTTLPAGRYRGLVRGQIGDTPIDREVAFQVGG